MSDYIILAFKNEIFSFLQAVTKMVQEVFTYVDKIDHRETKLTLIDTLRTVTAGKVCFK